MAYTTIDDPTQYFEALIWTGDGNTPRSLTGLEFQLDMVWSKRRDDAAGHNILDSVRGAGVDAELCPSSAGVEGSNNQNAYGYLSAFTSDGFTVTEGSSDNAYWNNNTATYVAWCWKAGGSASSNTNGDITSSVSANTTAGFSIVSYTGTGTSEDTIGHGLGSIPKMIITKQRDQENGWGVYHHTLGTGKELYLNYTNGEGSSNFWITTPTTSVFSVSASDYVNESSSTYIAYLFAPKQGFSKFGSYTGNQNADGTFVYTGFKPAFVMVKRSSDTEDWHMFDNKREGYNVDNDFLQANTTNAEATDDNIDILSNGFKLRGTGTDVNRSGHTYIYMAFAEAPFVNSNGVPNNAR